MAKPTVLVTGAAGLLGANFCKHLCDKGYKVVGVDNLSGGYREFVDPRVEFYNCELTWGSDIEFATSHVDGKIDYIYHFAAYAAAGLSPFIRVFNFENNVIASANLINYAINNNVKKFIFASSMEVYGDQPPPFDESMELMPDTPYGVAKLAVELDLRSAHLMHGLDYAIVRPHNVHGVYQNIWDRYRNVIGIFIRKALNGEELTIFGDGSQVRAFSDVQYYNEPFERLMFEHSCETFNIGADKPTTILELAKAVQKVAGEFGNRPEIVFLEPRKEVKEAFCDHSKAKSLLNFEDKTDLEKLIKKMYVWAQGQPNRKVKKMEVEIEKGLYSYWK